jgi:hypothetical protein
LEGGAPVVVQEDVVGDRPVARVRGTAAGGEVDGICREGREAEGGRLAKGGGGAAAGGGEVVPVASAWPLQAAASSASCFSFRRCTRVSLVCHSEDAEGSDAGATEPLAAGAAAGAPLGGSLGGAFLVPEEELMPAEEVEEAEEEGFGSL